MTASSVRSLKEYEFLKLHSMADATIKDNQQASLVLECLLIAITLLLPGNTLEHTQAQANIFLCQWQVWLYDW